MMGKRALGAGSRSSLLLPNYGFDVVSLVVGDVGGEPLNLLGRDESHTVRDLLETGKFQSLA
jgi:hypothetical protein